VTDTRVCGFENFLALHVYALVHLGAEFLDILYLAVFHMTAGTSLCLQAIFGGHLTRTIYCPHSQVVTGLFPHEQLPISRHHCGNGYLTIDGSFYDLPIEINAPVYFGLNY